MQLLGQLKNKLVFVVIGYNPPEISRFTNLFLNYGGRIEAKVFSPQYKPTLIPSEGLEIPLVVKCLISEEKSAILKHLQKLINLNYEELTSVGTPQNEVIVKEELGQDYNLEDENIVFIRLVFSRFMDLHGNLGNIKKTTRETCFSGEKKRLASRIYHAKFCLAAFL